MSDLIKELRHLPDEYEFGADEIITCMDAATVIEQQGKRIEQLEALLKVAKCPDPNCEDGVVQVFTGEVYQCQWCAEREENKDE